MVIYSSKTFGGYFESDGRPIGQESIETVQCNQGNCSVIVYAPSYALVFLDNNALIEVESGPSTTFSTSVIPTNTLTVNPVVLATSNGQRGLSNFHHLGSTSKESLVGGAVGMTHILQDAVLLECIAVVSVIVLRVMI